jgi:hypothetical protein
MFSMMKYALLALLLAFVPTQALAGLSCYGGQERGASTYLADPIGRTEPTEADVSLDPGTYILDKVCSDNGNITLLYMKQDATDDFYYLALTSEIRSFLYSLGLLE